MRNFIRNLQAMWTRPLYRENGYVRKDIEKLQSQVRGLEARVSAQAGAHEHVGRRFDAIYEGLGGQIWRTQAGHARFLAILSSEHLENIKLWPGSNAKVIHLCNQELERRRIDLQFRAEDEYKKKVLAGIRKERLAAESQAKRKGKSK